MLYLVEISHLFKPKARVFETEHDALTTLAVPSFEDYAENLESLLIFESKEEAATALDDAQLWARFQGKEAHTALLKVLSNG
jgi:hypothetical protein